MTGGFEYFLEADVIREILEAFVGRPNVKTDDACRFAIYYAENDAYPDWANDFS